MGSVESTVRLLRADGRFDDSSSGSSRALLLHVLTLPAATAVSSFKMAMRLLRVKGTLDDARIDSSRALLSRALAPSAAT